MKIYCPVDDDVISRSDTVKGFEYAPGQYVVVTDEDLESVPLKTVRSIEIEQFTPRDGVDDSAVGSSSRPTTSSPTRSAARPSTCSRTSSRRRGSRRSARS